MPDLGLSTKGASDESVSFGQGDLRMIKVTLPVWATLSAFSAYIYNSSGATVTILCGIYADNAGVPGTLVEGSTRSVATGTNAFVSMFTPAKLYAPGDYWLCIGRHNTSDMVQIYYNTPADPDAYNYNGTYTACPASAPAAASNPDRLYSIYVTYSPVFDASKFTCWPQAALGTGQWLMVEGITPAETGADTTATRTVSCGTAAYVDVATFEMPFPRIGYTPTLKAGTYAVVLRAWGVATCNTRVVLDVDGGATTFASAGANPAAAEADQVFTIVVGADTVITSSLTLKFQGQGVGAAKNVSIRPVHANVRMGAAAGYAGNDRSPCYATPLTPGPTTHSEPQLVTSPGVNFRAWWYNVYPEDSIDLVKYADTSRSDAHAISDAVTQLLGTASDITADYPVLGTRVIEATAGAGQMAAVGVNTYYEMVVTDVDGNEVGTLEWDLLLDVYPAALISLNGATAATYVTTLELEPWVRWTDPNDATTHYRVKVYRESDDAEMWDSGETAVGAAMCQIPAAANLLSLTTYYVVVTLMQGSGGSGWTVDARGYFRVDYTATTVKITSHEGDATAPALVTDTTPTVAWSFPKTQHSFNLTVFNEDTGAVLYNSAWIVSATQSHTIPGGSALTPGVNYSIQVQVKDAVQNHVYSADKRAWVHGQDATVSPPALTAEADADTDDEILLEWAAPAVTDGDTLSFTLSLQRTLGAEVYPAELYQTDATSLLLGRLYPGTYTWTAMATDEHGMDSAYAVADVFVIAAVGAVAVVTLDPRAAGVAPLVTAWTYTDVDDHVQNAYQVQLASDAGFTTIVEDSGTVASTVQYFTHATVAPGTYYRRGRIQTNGEWSAYDDDAVTITAPTVQTDDLAIFTDALGAPAALAYPVSGGVLTRRLDGPASFAFVVNNFDGLEGGLADDEDILVQAKDSDGNRIEFLGQVVDKAVGDLVEVVAEDQARLFSYWKVTRWLYSKTLGQIIKAIVENYGAGSTGITAHCDEVAAPDSPGDVVRVKMFVGGGRSLQEWLDEFAKATGFRWYLDTVAGAVHFHWYNPAAAPAWAITLKDNIDWADNSATQLRVDDQIKVTRSRRGYANRIRYQASLVPPEPPFGYPDYDSFLTDDATRWTAWNARTVVSADAADMPAEAPGSNSIKFTYTWTPGAATTWPVAQPLAYLMLPLDWQDQTSPEWGFWKIRAKMQLTINGVVQAETALPQGGIQLYYICGDQSRLALTNWYSGAANLVADGSWAAGWCTSGDSLHPPWSTWSRASFVPARQKHNRVANAHKHIVAIGIGYYYWGRAGGSGIVRERRAEVLGPPALVGGKPIKIEVWIDDMGITSAMGQPGVDPNDDSQSATPPTIELTVESAAVTAGTELPAEEVLNTAGLSRREAGKLALARLAEINKTRISVSAGGLDGIRNVPMRSRIPLVLPRHGLASVVYPLSDVTYRFLDAGDTTTITAGDIPSDPQRSLENLRKALEKLKTAAAGA